MSRMISEIVYQYKKLLIMGLAASTAILGFGLLASFVSQEAYFGVILFIIMTLVFTLIIGIIPMYQNFNLSVTMSETRKKYLTKNLIGGFLTNMIFLLWIKFGFFLFSLQFRRLYSDFDVTEDIDFEALLQLPVLFFLAVFFVVFQLFIVSVVLKFGKKMIWILWGIWMVGCFSIGPIVDLILEEEENLPLPAKLISNVLHAIVALNMTGRMLIATGVLAAMLLAMLLLIRKQRAL